MMHHCRAGGWKTDAHPPRGQNVCFLRSDLGINTPKTLFERVSLDSRSYQEMLLNTNIKEGKK